MSGFFGFLATSLEQKVSSQLNVYSSAVSGGLATYLVPIAVAGTTIYFLKTGFAIARGDVTDPMSKLLKDVITMLLVAAFALSAGNYQYLVVGGIEALISDLISTVTTGGATSVAEAMTQSWDVCVQLPAGTKAPPDGVTCMSSPGVFWYLAQKNKDVLGLYNFDYLVAWLLAWVGELFITVACLLPWLLAKMGLAIYLAIGPAFVLCLMWPITRQYFNSWLSALLGNALTLVIVAGICSVSSVVMKHFVIQSLTGEGAAAGKVIDNVLGMFFVSIGLTFTALKAAQMGSQLAGGGVAMDGSGLIGQMINAYTNMKGRNNPGNGDGGKDKDKNSAAPTGPITKAANQAGQAVGNALGAPGRAVSNVLKALDKRK